MFKTQKDDIASRPISRGPVSKKPKIDSRQDNSDDNSNLDGDDEHGSLFCTSRYYSQINFSEHQKKFDELSSNSMFDFFFLYIDLEMDRNGRLVTRHPL